MGDAHEDRTHTPAADEESARPTSGVDPEVDYVPWPEEHPRLIKTGRWSERLGDFMMVGIALAFAGWLLFGGGILTLARVGQQFGPRPNTFGSKATTSTAGASSNASAKAAKSAAKKRAGNEPVTDVDLALKRLRERDPRIVKALVRKKHPTVNYSGVNTTYSWPIKTNDSGHEHTLSITMDPDGNVFAMDVE